MKCSPTVNLPTNCFCSSSGEEGLDKPFLPLSEMLSAVTRYRESWLKQCSDVEGKYKNCRFGSNFTSFSLDVDGNGGNGLR